jgi:uncharacterized ubiquitin-like protein YukD
LILVKVDIMDFVPKPYFLKPLSCAGHDGNWIRVENFKSRIFSGVKNLDGINIRKGKMLAEIKRAVTNI